MLSSIITAILAFVSTNIDDIFILMLFFGSKKFRLFEIISGQYLGIGTLVVASLVGAYIGSFFDHRYIGLLGLFPVYLAISNVIELIKNHGEDLGKEAEAVTKSLGIISIAGVTIASGGDNVGVYIPLFTTMTSLEQLQLILVFFLMVYPWCLIASYLATHPVVAKQLDKYGHLITPVVLLALGLYIIIESKTLSLFTNPMP